MARNERKNKMRIVVGKERERENCAGYIREINLAGIMVHKPKTQSSRGQAAI